MNRTFFRLSPYLGDHYLKLCTQPMHATGGNVLGGGKNLPVQALLGEKALFSYVNLHVNNSIGSKATQNFLFWRCLTKTIICCWIPLKLIRQFCLIKTKLRRELVYH